MKYLKLVTFLLVTTVMISGCTDDFDELNTRTDSVLANQIDGSSLGAIFAQTQYATMNGLHWRFQISENLFSDLYAQYFSTTAPNFDSDRHVEVGRWIDLAWSSFYGEAAPQLKFVEDFAAENNLALEGAIAKVWKVQAYHRITDYWGPVIFSEFGGGGEGDESGARQFGNVSYDTQESIYRSFFPTLDEAVAVLKANAGGNAFSTNDQIYGGDADQWLAFANSLRLRLAMRVKYADAALARTEAEKAVADGVMMDNSNNAAILTTPNSKNPFNTITNWGEFRMSADMESYLKGYNDPRLEEFFSTIAGFDANNDGDFDAEEGDIHPDEDGDGSDDYQGLRNGLLKIDKNAAKNAGFSDMAGKYLPGGGNGPGIKVMSASEVYFLLAEGALEGWNMGGTAQKFYEKGIELSLTEITTASKGDIAAYISSTSTPADIADEFNSGAVSTVPVAYNAGGAKEDQLKQIITQKWIALYPDGWEAWAELRRTGYPELYPRLNSDNVNVPADQIMRRVTFVTGEFSNNRAATEAAQGFAELSGGDLNSTRVWWDKK